MEAPRLDSPASPTPWSGWLSFVALAVIALFVSSTAARAQFEPNQCFEALTSGPTGLKNVAENPSAGAGDYLQLVAQNTRLDIVSGRPLVYVADLFDPNQLNAEQQAAMQQKLTRLRAAIGDYVVVVMATELRRVTPEFLVKQGRFVPPVVQRVQNIGSPPTRYGIEIAAPSGDHGKRVPPMGMLVNRQDCKLVDFVIGRASLLDSIGQDLKAIGDLDEAERQLRAKIAEITAAQ